MLTLKHTTAFIHYSWETMETVLQPPTWRSISVVVCHYRDDDDNVEEWTRRIRLTAFLFRDVLVAFLSKSHWAFMTLMMAPIYSGTILCLGYNLFIVLLGHPHYYIQFIFINRSQVDFSSPLLIPPTHTPSPGSTQGEGGKYVQSCLL